MSTTSIIVQKKNDKNWMYIRKKQFDKICTEYMDEFGFEWVEEFTLNGA